MNWKEEWKKLAAIIAVFLCFFWLPVEWSRFNGGVMEALHLAKWYAREHVLLCLVPAFFIASAIGVFVSQASVMKYLGPQANKALAYGVAAGSGTILAVCSCTILPLFAGIYRMGAGLGPAIAFLYSGPAISVLAIVLTARILGPELGIARAVGAISFSIIIGLIMHFIYRKEEARKTVAQAAMPAPEVKRPLWQNAAFFAALVGILVFANWGAPREFRLKTVDGKIFNAAVIQEAEDTQAPDAAMPLMIIDGPDAGQERPVSYAAVADKAPLPGVSTGIWQAKWIITSVFAVALGLILIVWFGMPWWKVLVAGLPVVVLALILPADGLMIMIPFAAAVIGLSVITSTDKGEAGEWFASTWGFAKQIMPLLLMGVIVAGFLLGRVSHEGFIPSRFVQMLVGDKPDTFLSITGLAGGGMEAFIRVIWSFWTNFFASVFGAFMYFATLTEVPIVQGLIGSGMGKGPALTLLLSGPSLSLPSMLVIASVLGTRKTVVYVALVIVLSTVAGMLYGAIFG
ncbi:MAG: permease [Planctomycetota bacterium]